MSRYCWQDHRIDIHQYEGPEATPMIFSLELAKLSINERQQEGDESRLASLARQIVECCKPLSLRMRLAAVIRAAGDVCCPSDQERLMRAIRAANGN
jgi:hypothetical protein